jgi:putative ABC transport system permease protein
VGRRFAVDVRYALRLLRRNPGFAAVAVLVLALAIGVNAAAFGLVDALLFKPLPVRAPDQLVRVAASATDGAVSYADYLDYRSGARSLSDLGAFTADKLEYRAEGSDQTERVAAYLVSDNYFEVLGVDLALGRGFAASADTSESPGVVLSDAFWRTRFAADRGVLGRSVSLNGVSFAVIGVAPPRFTGTLRGGAPHLFVPFTSQVPREELLARGRRGLIAVGRLAPTASVQAAQAELSVVARRLAASDPQTNRGVVVTVGPERTALFREAPPLAYVVVVVYGMFGLLLAVACVNLAGLLTARSTFRRREIAVRAMLGASPRALVAQLLTESLVLALLGGAGGLLVGVTARNLLWSRLQNAISEHLGFEALWIDTQVDLRVAIFTVAITVGSTVLFGLVPARHASKQDLYGRAKDDPSSPPPAHLARLRRLVAGQVMLSALLLACAGLLLQTVRNATSTDMGYPLDRIYVADLHLSGGEKGQAQAAFERVLSRVRGLPGVEAAALGGGGWPGYLPQSATPGRPRQNYVIAMVGPAFFEALRIPILAGREFDARDTSESAPVAILNQRLAEALWPGQDPVGRKLVVWNDKPAVTVVGLTKTVRSFPLGFPPVGRPFFMIYVPLAQHDLTKATLHVRTARGQGHALRRRLPEELRSLHLGLSSVRVRSLADAVGSLLAVPRAVVKALGSLGAVGLFLAAVGLYGVTAYVAGRRARECAIRRVVGASRLSILRLLVGGAMRTVLIGLGAGVGLSLAVGWLLKDALLGAAFDPRALVLAPLVLVATAFLAVALPVFRAASVDPMIVLREE